jgi:hypothetical protein
MINIDEHISAIRILPMSRSIEFTYMNIAEVQKNFFVEDLYRRNDCSYLFRSSGMNAEEIHLFYFSMKDLL